MSSRNNEGCWTVPGGGLEPGETANKTALREITEEVCKIICYGKICMAS